MSPNAILDLMIFAFSVPALWLMGKKKKSCFIIFTAVNVMMVFICLRSSPVLWGVLVMQAVYMSFNIRSFILWSKSETQSEIEKFTP